MALSTTDGLEEERRLFYVAVTRARRRCTSTCRCATTTGPRRPALMGPTLPVPHRERARHNGPGHPLRPDPTNPAELATVDTTRAVDAALQGLFE